MHTYETCLISISGKVSVFLSANYFSDAAAIHAAHGFCKHGELVQVWRDDVCIHNEDLGQLPHRIFESSGSPLRS